MDLRITHETRYEYQSAVETAQHVAYLCPLETPWQTVRWHQLDIDPVPAQRDDASDVYGNRRSFFALLSPHIRLRVTAHSLVSTRAPLALQPGISRIGWEELRERFRYHAKAQFHPASEFSFASPRAPRHQAFADYARPSFVPGRSALAAALDLMQRIHDDFQYQSGSTEVHTSALEALQMRQGVCQDFAHIMLGCLRSMGLAARYVSGYLLTQPPPGQPRLIGSDASHAWVALWLPDLPPDPSMHAGASGPTEGWCDLDPTNARAGLGTPGEDYILLATGRDYSDVTPLRGVIHGGGEHRLQVAVTVAPVDE